MNRTPSSTLTAEKPKRPWLAAILALVLGPFGLLYLGWRYAVTFFIAIVVFVIFSTSGMGFGIPPWVRYFVVLLLAYKAFLLAKARNEVVGSGDADVLAAVKSFPMAVIASTDLFVGLSMLYVGASVAVLGIADLVSGQLLRGLLICFLGVPIMVILVRWFAGLLAAFIDAMAWGALRKRHGDLGVLEP